MLFHTAIHVQPKSEGNSVFTGVLMTCFINTMFIRAVLGSTPTQPESCKTIEGLPDMPLGQTILGFTFAYLVFIITKHKMWGTNGFTAVIFPLLILGDFAWNIQNSCATATSLALALALGITCGYIWGLIINRVDSKQHLFNGISDNVVCNRPAKTKYSCRLKQI